MDFDAHSLQERLAGKCLFIATPCYGAQVALNYHSALVETMLFLRGHQIPCIYQPTGGDSLVQRARNVLVGKFLESSATHLLFIDADIGWKPMDVLGLLAGGKDIAGGVYPKKGYPIEWPANPYWDEDGQLERDSDTGWIRWKDMPTGFLMVSRKCIEGLIAKHPELKCTFDPGSGRPEPNSYSLFDCFTDSDGIYLSEDFGFCRRAQRAGYTVWCNPCITLSHFGGHMFAAGSIAESMFPHAEASIEGWMTHAELSWLKAAASKVESIIEIGSWKGRSTHALASACPGIVWAIDTWRGSPEDLAGPNAPHAEALTGNIYGQFLANVGDCDNVVPIRGESVEVAASNTGLRADMIFIDASHDYDAVLADIQTWRGRARKLICGHDWDRPGVRQAVTEEFGRRASVAAGSIWQVWL